MTTSLTPEQLAILEQLGVDRALEPVTCSTPCHGAGIGCACRPWPVKYPGRVHDVIDGRPVTLEPSPTFAMTVPSQLPSQRPDPVGPIADPAKPIANRVGILGALLRRPSRVTQLEGLLNRYRWANAGLRERLARLDHTITAVDAIADQTAAELGHRHPVVLALRAVIAEARS